jgi:hypothetical protein
MIMRPKIHPLAIIVSQGCDLEQDFYARQRPATSDKVIPAVLFCEMISAAELRSRLDNPGSGWKRISQNDDQRYHFFQTVEPEFDAEEQGLGELGVDFKRFFTVPTDEVYHRIRVCEAKRRCFLGSPYLEHFCVRFANFMSRIALPQRHESG